MPTDEQRALWAAIRAHPDDDTPRLVYADWLQEHGDEPRAEFIRIQIELAQLGHDRRKGRKRRPIIEPREKALLAAHRYEWGAEFYRVMNTPPSAPPPANWHPISLANYSYRRGFLYDWQVSFSRLSAIAAADDTLEPVEVTGVAFNRTTDIEQDLRTALEWPGATALVHLWLGGDDAIRVLTATNHLRRLRYLDMTNRAISDDGVRELALWPTLANVTSLVLSGNPITDAGARWLAESPYLSKYSLSLMIGGTQITDTGRNLLSERLGARV
jgi:uncharacterized protein (TIGR02996 family)